MAYDKKNLKGSGANGADDADFLRTCNPNSDRGNWDRQSGSEGPYGQNWADETGPSRGSAYGFSDAIDSDLALRNVLPDESRDRSLDHLVGLEDDSRGMGSGSEILGGGGAVPKNRTVGDGTPRYGAKPLAPRQNSRRK